MRVNSKIKQPQVRYLKSAVWPEDYPAAHQPELAFVGRSNVGKSSLLNALSQHKLAFVSRKPGKTRFLNFFQWNQSHIIVDVPGYGFAQRPQKERLDWKTMIETYLTQRETLKSLVLICDVRRDWSQDEELILDWARTYNKSVFIVLNKIDKLGQSDRAKKKKEFLHLSDSVQVFWISTYSGAGIDELRKALFS